MLSGAATAATARAARTAEPTIRNDARQVDMFGTADAAVQAQAARDQAGRGALLPKGEQKPADEGLFAPRRDDDRTPLYSALTRAVEGMRQEKATPG